jgi:hypothetical protein
VEAKISSEELSGFFTGTDEDTPTFMTFLFVPCDLMGVGKIGDKKADMMS